MTHAMLQQRRPSRQPIVESERCAQSDFQLRGSEKADRSEGAGAFFAFAFGSAAAPPSVVEGATSPTAVSAAERSAEVRAASPIGARPCRSGSAIGASVRPVDTAVSTSAAPAGCSLAWSRRLLRT
eukprot:4568269-Prymnesium_polylepis.1